MSPKIIVIADGLTYPFDEGFKNITFELCNRLVSSFNATLVVGNDACIPLDATRIKLGKTFFNLALFRLFFCLKPDLIIYLSASSLTFASIVRSAVIRLFSLGATTVVFGFQQRKYGAISRLLVRKIKPTGIVVLSERMKRDMNGLASWVKLFTPGVNLNRFRPAEHHEKLLLRNKYGIPEDDFVILHVGHIKKSRNLPLLVDLAAHIGARLLIVTSSTFEAEKDKALEAQISHSGALIMSGTIDAIEELYRLADCYAFPVQNSHGATEMPLSVLEAMSSNLAVITTSFGSLPDTFSEDRGAGYYYIDDLSSAISAITSIRELHEIKTRQMVFDFSLERQIDNITNEIIIEISS